MSKYKSAFRIIAVFFFIPLKFGAAPVAEVHQKCLQNSREVFQARIQNCRAYTRHPAKCRAEAEKEKRELLDYCAAGMKKQPATIVVTSH